MGVMPEQILLRGESLGTGLAVQLGDRAAGGRPAVWQSPLHQHDRAGAVAFSLRWPVGFLLRDRFDSLAQPAPRVRPFL